MDEPTSLYRYRDKDKAEVDVIIEVKVAATLSAKNFTGLIRILRVAGVRFKIGVLLYSGDHTMAFGENLYAELFGAL